MRAFSGNANAAGGAGPYADDDDHWVHGFHRHTLGDRQLGLVGLATHLLLDQLGAFQVYNQPFALPPNTRTLTAFSIDRNANVEVPFQTKSVKVELTLLLIRLQEIGEQKIRVTQRLSTIDCLL